MPARERPSERPSEGPSEGHSAAAEAILRLVLPAERAAAIVGDVVETHQGRSPAIWWPTVFGVVFSTLRQQIAGAALTMLACAGCSWLVFMAFSLAFTAAGAAVAYVGWTATRLATEHTGLELVRDAFGWRALPPPSIGALLFVAQAVAMWIAAPYLTGKMAARWCAGRELAVCVVMAAVWPVLAYAAPLVIVRMSWTYAGLHGTVGTSATWLGVPLMMLFVLCGGYRQRVLKAREPVPARG